MNAILPPSYSDNDGTHCGSCHNVISDRAAVCWPCYLTASNGSRLSNSLGHCSYCEQQGDVNRLIDGRYCPTCALRFTAPPSTQELAEAAQKMATLLKELRGIES